jgi:MFS transporter, DHA1 family, multidrug resistance protein
MSLLDFFFGSNQKSIPDGVRTITRATAVRWIGWGFAEALIPVFIFSFSHNYATSGLLSSVYDIAFILTLPIVGLFADVIPSAAIILVAVLFYPLIGISYFVAGVTGLVIFIVLARVINGVLYAMDSVGRESYIRQHTKPKHASLVFGYADALANAGWVAAALCSIALVRFLSIPWLLLLIVPFSIIAFFMILPLVDRKKDFGQGSKLPSPVEAYTSAFREIILWDWRLQFLAMVDFFVSFASAVVAFFVPIYAYTQGTNLGGVLLIGVALTIPYVFGFRLGKIIDHHFKSSLPYGLFLLSAFLFILSFANHYALQLAISFCVAMVVEFIVLANAGTITVVSKPDHFGRVTGLMDSIGDLGSLAGPIVVGILIDALGIAASFRLVALVMIVLLGMFLLGRRYLIKST